MTSPAVRCRRPLALLILLSLVAAAPVLAASSKQQASPRQVLPFDAAWSFLQQDAPTASDPAFDDHLWTKLDLPHDWAIAGPFAATNPSGGAGAFAPAGIGWYRKRFTLPQADTGKRLFIEFDGIMANSDVWINGFLLGHRPSGYISLRYDLTPHLHFGPNASNLLAIRADNAKQPASRFYEGAGIYRHVRLLIENPIHTVGDTTFVSTPTVSATAATVHIQTEIANEAATAKQVSIRATILAPNGRIVATASSPRQNIAPGAHQTLELSPTVTQPDRWDIDHPALYRLRLEVLAGGKLVDTDPVTFGIREFHFEPATGFWLNGRNLKIKGVALHSDVGSLGLAAPLGAWEHRLAAMRQLGANAIRTAHNPVAPEFLDLCDRLGFLVMDEMFDQWTVAKNPFDYHLYFRDWFLKDTHDTVLRDRNHPSIILYSAGNEIHDTPRPEIAKPILAALVAEFHRDDPTRPVTQALFRPNVSHDYENGLADLLDVVGQNYRTNELLAAYAQRPTRKIIGTENIHDRQTWLAMRDHPEFSGEFIWAGVDYLGESRHWPLIGDASGLYDRTDTPKPDGLEMQSWWSDAPVLHLARRVAATPLAPTDPGYEAEQYRPRQVVFPDWTPTSLSPHDEQVEVYTNCAEVELLLNGQTLGHKPRNPDASPLHWSISFTPGTLQAVGSNGNASCTTETLHTAGAPARLLLTVERTRLSPSWDDVAYLRATVVDAAGTILPNASTPLHFDLTGPARLLATDNADNANPTSFSLPDRHAFHGQAIAILRATAPTGQVTLTVSSPGLAPASTSLPILTGPRPTLPSPPSPHQTPLPTAQSPH